MNGSCDYAGRDGTRHNHRDSGTSADWSPGALIALGYVYAPRERRNLIQAGVTVAVVMLFTVLIWRHQ
jgi:hypothetical protein